MVDNPPGGRFKVPAPISLGLSEPDPSGTRHLLKPAAETPLGRWQVAAGIMVDIDPSGAPPAHPDDDVTTELLVLGSGQLLVTDQRVALVFEMLRATGLFEGVGLPPGALLFASFSYDWMLDVAYETSAEEPDARVWMAGPSGGGWGRVFVAAILTTWATQDGGAPGTLLVDLMDAVVTSAGSYRLGVVPDEQATVVTRTLDGHRVQQGRMAMASLGSWTPTG